MSPYNCQNLLENSSSLVTLIFLLSKKSVMHMLTAGKGTSEIGNAVLELVTDIGVEFHADQVSMISRVHNEEESPRNTIQHNL